ncbi:hypothetical protein [Micromonospora sp. KC721]|uniref:hypothetical protein n=1 Tax=Micromonospora sp. KC721 TaxID=2530380 RepID=UPI001A9F63DA|nr:hypothetical protein [Micromonospora sp. KC721]
MSVTLTGQDKVTRRTAGSKAAAGQDRPELQKAIQEIVDSGFVGVQLRVHDERGEWVGSVGVRKLDEAGKPPTNGHHRIGSNTNDLVHSRAGRCGGLTLTWTAAQMS